MRISRQFAVATLALCLSAPVLLAQTGYEGPNGPVEVLGLRSWTLPMLRDSIRHYAPGQDLHDAACMVTLKEKLGFVDALVMEYTGYTGDGKTYLVIKVVEPQFANRVKWNATPTRMGQSLLPNYAELVQAVTDSTGAVHVGRIEHWLQFSLESRAQAAARTPSDPRRGDPKADAERVTAFQRTRNTEVDRQRAMKVLSNDSFWANRFAAAAVLANFGERDSTWTALVHALRDPDASVRGAALFVLGALPKRPVDWRPAVEDLRALIGGTNVSGVSPLFRVLTATRISPDLAGPLLSNNAEWVLDHVASSAPVVSDDARALLRQLNRGVSAGPKRTDWETWVKKLGSQ